MVVFPVPGGPWISVIGISLDIADYTASIWLSLICPLLSLFAVLYASGDGSIYFCNPLRECSMLGSNLELQTYRTASSALILFMSARFFSSYSFFSSNYFCSSSEIVPFLFFICYCTSSSSLSSNFNPFLFVICYLHSRSIPSRISCSYF